MSTSRERVSIDDVVENLPLIVRRELRILAAFARLKAVTEWATDKSYSDESLYGGTHPSHLPCARRKRITAESWGQSMG